MEVPYTLATLPKLLDADHGRIQASPVVTLRNSRKRKRHEIVVGIDGDGVVIFSVNAQSHTVLSAYAIPPHSYLCCPPASIYTQLSPARRDTFSVLKDGPRDRRRRLVRHTEQIHESSGISPPIKSEYKLKDGEVLGVEGVPTENLGAASSPRALVIYKDGTLICVDGSMSTADWTQSVLQSDDENASLEYATFTDPAAARKGILRHRDDIVATLSSSTTDSLLLGCFIIRRNKNLLLRLCTINTSRSKASIQPLDDLQLPSQGISTTRKWQLHADVGKLYCLVGGLLAVTDLTELVPRLNTTIKDRRAPIETFLALSASTVVTLSENRIALHDSKYGSDQGSIVLDDNIITSIPSRKRKRGDGVTPADRPGFCSFPDMGCIVLVTKNLSGIQLKPQLLSLQQKSSNTTVLSEVLGKGIAKHIIHMSNDGNNIAEGDNDWYEQVESLISNVDTAGLEQLVEQNFDVGHMLDEEGLWIFDNSPCDLGLKRYRRALVILERLFVPIKAALDTPARLHLRLMSCNIVRWLTQTGMLSAKKLTAVLGVPVTSVHIADALSSVDSSFQLLQDVLGSSVHLPPSFVVECLRLLIKSLDSSPIPGLLALEAPPADTPNTEDAEVEQESRSAEKELSNALTALESGLETRSETMRHIFSRLHATPLPSLTKHLQAGLEQQELLFFIHLLRMELADAGWTGRYMDVGASASVDPEEEESSPSDNAIRTIGDLLIAAVDAIGAAGWLVGLASAEDEKYGVLDALRAEISASVEGAYEAHALHSHLSELERYADALELMAPRLDQHKKKGVIEVTSSLAGEDSILPTGGRSSIVNTRRPPDRRSYRRNGWPISI